MWYVSLRNERIVADELYVSSAGSVSVCVTGALTCISPRVSMFTDRSTTVLLLWIIFVGYVSHTLCLYYTGLVARKHVFGVRGQQRRRPACASAQSDQSHCYSLIEKYRIQTCLKRYFNILTSLCSWAGWFESHLVENPADRFSRDEAHTVLSQRFPAAVWSQAWKRLASWFVCVMFPRREKTFGFPTKWVSNKSPKLQRLASKLFFQL